MTAPREPSRPPNTQACSTIVIEDHHLLDIRQHERFELLMFGMWQVIVARRRFSQRDQEQAEEYGSPDIRTTDIACFSLKQMRAEGLGAMMEKILRHIHTLDIDGFWIHFDTDVLADEINPAVDYKLPGGLQFNEATMLLSNLLATGKAAGISVTIYNGDLDANAYIARQITDCLGKAFSPNEQRN